MASRKQKRAKKFRRQHEQESHRSRIHREAFDEYGNKIVSDQVPADAVVIERPGGPKQRRGFRRTDPPRFGRQAMTDSRRRLDAFVYEAIRTAGIEVPEHYQIEDELRRSFFALAKQMGGPDVARDAMVTSLRAAIAGKKMAMADAGLTKVSARIVRAVKNDFNLLETTGSCALNGLQLTDGSPARHPTEEEWEEITSEAKRRKRSLATFAAKAGFEQVDENSPRERTSWLVSEASS